ncbi:NAD(P)-dependent oxidoreductase [Paracoccus albus]|uniref:NAD(P)-dependent oxidoreductase n=1 Tax=Paracoccus albus TaxID=3017784 RepID=UPI0022F0DFBE|nr:NAD(P)-dependent oxidoreductase [Paracoccus albus]WBU61505.1 NAD(P)-dependent oxidoreductase [Paracoccus albus]
MSTVAIIGFGTMGRVAGSRIMEAGHIVRASDPQPASMDAARGMGAAPCPTPKDAAAGADVVLLFLPGPAQIASVVSGPEGLLTADQNGLVIVDHSTADPATARDMAAKAVEAGAGWVDAPVLGRPSAAGKWALPCGASEGALEKVRPVLETYARAVFPMGPPGSGHTVKLLNQMMFGAINAMTAEMMATSARMGIEPAKLYEIITASQAGTVSNLFKELGSRIAQDDYEKPTFSLNLLEKDVRLGLEMAASAGVSTSLGDTVAAMNRQAIAQGYGDQDSSVMWKSLDER